MDAGAFGPGISGVMWSAATGIAFGLIWAIASCSGRRRLFLSAGVPPSGQAAWFAISMASMGCYVAFITMLGFLAAGGAIPALAFWFLLMTSSGAFGAALWFANLPRPSLPEPLAASPRIKPEPPRRHPGHRSPWRPAIVSSGVPRSDRLQEPGSVRRT